jgi:hypothetical protein
VLVPISAVDAINPAFQHAKKQLMQPFRIGQWSRLAFVGFLAGELSSGGGCNVPNFQIPQTPSGSHKMWAATPPWMPANPVLAAALIAAVIIVAITLWLAFAYLNSMMRFVLFDSVINKECRIREYWSRRMRPGFRYFLWQLGFGLCLLMAMTILLGIPAAIALAAGWLNNPSQHLAPLILGGIFLFFVFLALFLCAMLIVVFTKDFIVPQMALEDISAMEGWRRFWGMLKAEQGGYAGYVGMKIVLAIGASIILGIVTFIVILVVAIPAGGVGVVIAILASKTAHLTWNAYTITLVVIAASMLLTIILFLVGFISVPASVFFPAYSIHFLASRYRALDAVLHPAPPSAPAPAELPPPIFPPFPSEPNPIS